jgi:hypothetical protein
VLALALGLSGAVLLWACGPFFPNWLLGDESLVLDGPTVRFDAEIHRLFPAAPAAAAPRHEAAGGSLAAAAAEAAAAACPPGSAAAAVSPAGGAGTGAGGTAAGGAASAAAGAAVPGGPGTPATGAAMPAGDAAPAGAAGQAEEPHAATARVDCEELAAALRIAGLAAARRHALLAAYGAVRGELLRQDAAAAAAADGNGGAAAASLSPVAGAAGAPASSATAAPATRAMPAVPAGLPLEFAQYLQGALAYRGGRPAAARDAWQHLLGGPAAERRQRSTWAAFMLGKAALRAAPPDLDGAVRWFRTTRELAGQGFADRLGLAAASLGWEARAEADRQHDDRALALYAEQARAGEPSAANSLRFLARAALAAGGPTLAAVAREPAARDAVTTLVLAHSIEPPWDLQQGDKPPPPPARAWLAAVRAAGLRQVPGADRLAWTAYLAGDFAAAAEWLGRAQAATPATRWVRARLLLREGRLEEGEKLLAGLGGLPASAALAQAEDDTTSGGWAGDPYLATPARALGEAGAAAVARGDFAAGLDHLLRAGYWLDAAYLAERVLGTAELRAYVDRAWPERLAAGAATTPVNPEGNQIWSIEDAQRAPSEPQLARAIRHLLGRRLVRDRQLAAARPYLPAALRPRLDALDAAARAGADPARPAAARAASLFAAACITRRQGLELLGTEIEPDWQVFGGDLAPDPLGGNLAVRQKNRFLRPTAAEVARAGHPTVEPWKRFHYRYLAAGLARSAADLLPDGSADKAGMLATAGRWLADRDAAAAKPFYAALVRCCGATDLGRAAVRQRWLPKADVCPAGTEAPAEPAAGGGR